MPYSAAAAGSVLALKRIRDELEQRLATARDELEAARAAAAAEIPQDGQPSRLHAVCRRMASNVRRLERELARTHPAS